MYLRFLYSKKPFHFDSSLNRPLECQRFFQNKKFRFDFGECNCLANSKKMIAADPELDNKVKRGKQFHLQTSPTTAFDSEFDFQPAKRYRKISTSWPMTHRLHFTECKSTSAKVCFCLIGFKLFSSRYSF